MSVTIETIVACDNCGANCEADDRSENAAEIRRGRKEWGWAQVGNQDFCEECVAAGCAKAARKEANENRERIKQFRL